MLKLLVVSIVAMHALKCDAYEKYVADALERLLDYVEENHRSMNIDGLFGLVLEQAHLQSIIISNDNHRGVAKIKMLENKTGEVIKLIKPHIKKSYKNLLFLEMMMVPKIWQSNLTFHHNRLDLRFEANKTFSSIDTYSKYLNYLATSKFLEDLSDRCFVEMLESQGNCSIRSQCAEYMIEDRYIDPAYGVTHRLLFLQTARTQKCNLDVAQKINQFCSYIFWEMSKNAEFGFLDELDDLLLEQVTLCGYEGFAEFLSDDLIEHVLNIQTEHGCFTVISPPEVEENVRRKRSKREANFIAFGCNDHSTGLGASVLALALRYLLQKSH